MHAGIDNEPRRSQGLHAELAHLIRWSFVQSKFLTESFAMQSPSFNVSSVKREPAWSLKVSPVFAVSPEGRQVSLSLDSSLRMMSRNGFV